MRVPSLRRVARSLLDSAADFLFPTDCSHCGRALIGRARFGVCLGCWSDVRPLLVPTCRECGLPDARAAGGRCPRCVLRPFGPDRTRAAVPYFGAARSLLLQAKLARRPEILRDLSRHLVAALTRDGWADGCDVVVAAPGDPLRCLARGFDPAVVLARPTARALAIPFARRAVSRRPGLGPQLKRLSAADRERRLCRAFRARARAVAGRRVLLIDDVVTTGSTARACCAALRLAGASEVRLACWARTLL